MDIREKDPVKSYLLEITEEDAAVLYKIGLYRSEVVRLFLKAQTAVRPSLFEPFSTSRALEILADLADTISYTHPNRIHLTEDPQ